MTPVDVAALYERSVPAGTAEALRTRLIAALADAPSQRPARLRTALRSWAPRLGAALAAGVVSSALVSPAQAAQQAAAVRHPVPAGPQVVEPAGTGLDDVIAELSEQVAELLAMLGGDPPGVSVDELARYLEYSFLTQSATFKVSVEDVLSESSADLAAGVPEGLTNVHARDYVETALMWYAWIASLPDGGRGYRYDYSGDLEKYVSDGEVAAALASGDMGQFRRTFLNSLWHPEISDAHVAKLAATVLDDDLPELRATWVDRIERVRLGWVPDSVVSADEVRQAYAAFVQFGDVEPIHRREGDLARAARGLLDAWVSRACAALAVERLREQIDALSALKAQRVRVSVRRVVDRGSAAAAVRL